MTSGQELMKRYFKGTGTEFSKYCESWINKTIYIQKCGFTTVNECILKKVDMNFKRTGGILIEYETGQKSEWVEIIKISFIEIKGGEK